jgi:hypothetical protein
MPNFGLFNYDDASKREDLLDILKDVSPNRDNWCYDNFGTSVATNPTHQWLTFNVARKTGHDFIAEGADFADDDNSQPVRSNNLTAIFRESVKVSGTERATKVGLPGDPMDFQKVQSLHKLKNQIEFSILNGTSKVSGASGTAREMAGLVGVISTNVTAFSSGATLSTTVLENILQMSWDAVGASYVADTLLVTMLHKRHIATFTTKISNQVQSTDTTYANITMYETSSGVVQIVPHKDLIAGAGTAHLLALNKEMYKIAWLRGREPKWYPIAKVGDADRGYYLGEGTLESLAERTSVKQSGFTTTGS